jgi:hypothetical protein
MLRSSLLVLLELDELDELLELVLEEEEEVLLEEEEELLLELCCFSYCSRSFLRASSHFEFSLAPLF